MNVPGRRWLRSKPVLVAVVVVLAAGAGVGIWLATSGSSSPTLTTTTSIVTASYGTVSQTASASGTIEPASQDDADFAVSGQVTAVDVSVGQTVKAGQTLATVDPSSLEADLASAQATLDSDEAKLDSDDSSSSTPSEQLTADKAAVTAAESSVTSAQDQLDDATLTAAIAGTVAEVNLAVGQQVSGTGSSSSDNAGSSADNFADSSSDSSSSDSSSSSSSDQIVIVNTGSWEVSASVDDSSIGDIATGDQVDIDPEGSSTDVYGTVASIGLIASQSSDVATFPVTVDVTGDPSGLYTGMSANLTVVVKELTDVLTVPTAALRYDDGTTEVEVDRDGSHVLQAVTVGTTSGTEAQITSGLTNGEQVVETVVHFSGIRPSGSNSTGSSEFPGGFGGGGFGGGGFGGGGFGGSGGL